MFSFLNFFNFKSDSDNVKSTDPLSGKTLNLNSPEARALNIFNQKLPISRRKNGNNTPFRPNCIAEVTSPGFSYRIAQRAREMRSTTPNSDISNLSVSYASKNNYSNSNSSPHEFQNLGRENPNDKKRKLMETLDNFGVRKKTCQEFDFDNFVNCPKKAIESIDRNIPLNGIDKTNREISHSPYMTPKNNHVIFDRKQNKRQSDTDVNSHHSYKRPKTRNNEILSSYSSSKFLLSSRQKRTYPIDPEGDDSPCRKHCKSCTCCGSTDDNNKSIKIDKTTETDLAGDLVTVAASRIFNRSGKTQVVKRISIKSVLDEVFDEPDPTPYTSIEKIEQKKNNAVKKGTSTNEKNSELSIKFPQSPTTSSIISPTVGSFEKTKNTVIPKTTSQFNFGSTTMSSAEKLKSLNEVDGVKDSGQSTLSPNKEIENQKSELSSLEQQEKSSSECSKVLESTLNSTSNDIISKESTESSVKTPFQFSALPSKSLNSNSSLKSDAECVKNVNKPETIHSIQFGNKESSGKNTKEDSAVAFNNCNINTSKLPAFTFKDNEKQPMSVLQFGTEKNENKQLAPVMQFGASKPEDKVSAPVMQFEASKTEEKQSVPVMQFGAPKTEEKQSVPVMQFGAPKPEEKQSIPVMQFGASKTEEKQFVPVMQFGASKTEEKQSVPVMQFGAPKTEEKQSVPVMQFGAPKTDEKEPLSTILSVASKTSECSNKPVFSFGQNTLNSLKSSDSLKFQFGSTKPNDNGSTIPVSTESKTVMFGSSNTAASSTPFSFGKTDVPQSSSEKSSLKLQFGTPPMFGNSSVEQINTNVPAPNNPGPKLVFGSQNTDIKPASSNPTMIFGSNTDNPVFQFNSSSTKTNEKPTETTNNAFQFSAAKTVPSFGNSTTQGFGDKPAFQFNAQKTDDQKSQFSSPSFGNQTAAVAPFKFGGGEKPAVFGSTFTSPNQPIEFSNKIETKTEPFKFGASTNAFQFSSNKNDSGPIKFGQSSNTFNSSGGFSGFGKSSTQPTVSFGNTAPSKPSPFGNTAAPESTSTFGSVAPTSMNTFGTTANRGFQFGNSNTSTSNNPSTFAFNAASQPAKPEGAFSFGSTTAAAQPFQFGQAPSLSSPQQFSGGQPQGAFGFGSPPQQQPGMQGSNQALFSIGTAPAGERRKAKAVRRRQ
ncbi:nuclear envelope pore membrane protein POM 121-like isoform X2 [Daktulosphaira vitifoliae]|uniref:nuclear envelope pore membrane protein POM 121-like isoform X2 n=1 Tax=Daktulosphaira vitifoliae TaxID=58002 RepID=UPI0021AAC3B6|nr:nuclear envelope pore membrane protein POM 121-like isoform X2 [Daktulosphaira vitifoliae]